MNFDQRHHEGLVAWKSAMNDLASWERVKMLQCLLVERQQKEMEIQISRQLSATLMERSSTPFSAPRLQKPDRTPWINQRLKSHLLRLWLTATTGL